MISRFRIHNALPGENTQAVEKSRNTKAQGEGIIMSDLLAFYSEFTQ